MGLSKSSGKKPVQSVNDEFIEDDQYILPFGKYEGVTVEELIAVNPKYLYWLHNAEGTFGLSFDLLDRVEEAIQNLDITDDDKGRRTWWRRK